MDLPLDLMEAHAGRASALLKSMANRARLMILCRLSQQEMTVTDLARTVPLSQSALSQQLAVLRREGLVHTRREAQFIWYSIDSEEAKAIIGTLYDLFCAQMEGEGPVA